MNVDDLEHGDLIELEAASDFVNLQKHLDQDLTYLIVGSQLDEGQTQKIAVAIHSLEDTTNFDDVMEWYVEEAIERFDWLGGESMDAKDVLVSELGDALCLAEEAGGEGLSGFDLGELEIETHDSVWTGQLELTRHDG